MTKGYCRLFAISLLFFFKGLNSFGQQPDSCVLKLKSYTVKPCLNELLTAIVSSNKCKNDACFYSLSLVKGMNEQFLTITTSFYKYAKFMNYTGIVKLKNVSFLLQGQFDDGILFKEAPLPLTKIKLIAAPPDTSDINFFREPVLVGYFSPCFISLPVYIEVYTRAEIAGYKYIISKEANNAPVIIITSKDQ
jgi:hypothetical protein